MYVSAFLEYSKSVHEKKKKNAKFIFFVMKGASFS